MLAEDDAPNDDFSVIRLTDVLDLHSVLPRDVRAFVEAFLEEAYLRDWTALRIIHGRGIGVQREIVRGVLAKTQFVAEFADAPAEAGGWGATLVTLLPGPRVVVVPATLDDQPVLANLMELYAHDFSEFIELELGADGRFGYPHLPLYWQEPDRHPFLIKVNGALSGFVLAKRQGDVWDMAEFFVVRGQRKRSIGTRAARQIWQSFPGDWEVRVMESNPAHRFWEAAIAGFVGQPVPFVPVSKDGRDWRVFRFTVHQS